MADGRMKLLKDWLRRVTPGKSAEDLLAEESIKLSREKLKRMGDELREAIKQTGVIKQLRKEKGMARIKLSKDDMVGFEQVYDLRCLILSSSKLLRDAEEKAWEVIKKNYGHLDMTGARISTETGELILPCMKESPAQEFRDSMKIHAAEKNGWNECPKCTEKMICTDDIWHCPKCGVIGG